VTITDVLHSTQLPVLTKQQREKICQVISETDLHEN